jgi:hypothetical protein
MDEHSILMSQIQVLDGELSRAEGALDAPQVDSDLRERVRVRFDKLIKDQQRALTIGRRQVESGQPLDMCWDGFREIRRECVPLFREILALIEGAMVRRAGLDGGLCRIADALLDDLSRRADIYWGRFTILADGEFFADMAEIIRLRFPETSIWNLPVAAHEFGHFVGPKLEVRELNGRSRHPFQDMLQREDWQSTRNWHYLHEHFADLFATYALGPAYACTCILLRFDPGTGYADGPHHPSDAKRVYLILNTLKKMDEAEGGFMRPYQEIISFLRDWWQRSSVAAGQPESLDQDATIPLDERLDELYYLVSTYLPSVQYRNWLRAQQISAELLPDREISAKLQGGDYLPHILNAAWLSRIQHWNENSYATRRIGDSAIQLCRQVCSIEAGEASG